MRVTLAGETRTGSAIDLRDFEVTADLDVSAVGGAVRAADRRTDDRRTSDCHADESPRSLSIDCSEPGLAHEHVGVIRAGMDLSCRLALAAAARTRGRSAPQADDLAAVRDRLDALDPPEIDLRAARRRVAETSDAADELRERVAALRGRVQALRDADGGGHGAAETELAEATRELAKVETERIAAEQALAHERERAAESRERRRERLRLEDRAANLQRDARKRLAGQVREAFEAARAEVPTGTDDTISTALAVARVADLDAPVVAAAGVDSFGSVEGLAEWLDEDVICL